MYGFIVPIIVGVICIIIGISNRKGNIESLHSYHRKRVTEEDRIPFGKKVGLGMIIIGVAVIIMGVASIIGVALENELYTTIGTVVMIVGLIIAFIIIFKALIKYNKGIF